MRQALKLLISLYPKAWRTRYENEFEALLEDVPPTWRTCFDVFAGAMKMQLKAWNSWKIVAAFAMVDLFRMTADADFWFFAWSRIYLGIGLPLIFIPITTASYDGIPPSKTDQASALINLARNFGGSMGVSLAQTVLARREQFHQSRLAEHVGSWNPFYADTLNHVQSYFKSHMSTGNVGGTSMAFIGQLVQTQAMILAYIDVFVALAVVAVVMVPLALSLRSVKRSGKPVAAH